MIAIDADYTTDFRFHPTRGCCCCFNSHNDGTHPAQKTVLSPTRLLLLGSISHNDVSLSLSLSPSRITTERFYGRRMGRRASVHRPTRLLCVCLSVFGNIIAIDADYTTDFKFHPTSLSIGTGMSEQTLWTKVRLFRDSNISHYVSTFVAN